MDQIKQIVKQSELSKAIFEMFSKRERYRGHTNLIYLTREVEEKKGLHVDQKELLQIFKSLEGLGLGTLVYGRKRSPTKFYWNYNLKEVAEVAMGKVPASELQPLKPHNKPKVDRNPMSTTIDDTSEIVLKIPKNTSNDVLVQIMNLLLKH